MKISSNLNTGILRENRSTSWKKCDGPLQPGDKIRIGFTKRDSIAAKVQLNGLNRLLNTHVSATLSNGQMIFLNRRSFAKHTQRPVSEIKNTQDATRFLQQFVQDYQQDVQLADALAHTAKKKKTERILKTVRTFREQEKAIFQASRKQDSRVSTRCLGKGKASLRVIQVPQENGSNITYLERRKQCASGHTKKAKIGVEIQYDAWGNRNHVERKLLLSAEQEESLTKEIQFLKKAQTVDGVVKLFNSFLLTKENGKTYQYTVEEFCEQGDLHHYLLNNEITDRQIIDFCGQVIQTFFDMKRIGIAQEDEKPENMLLTTVQTEKGPTLKLKLTDFDIAHTLGIKETSTGGTPNYMSPDKLHAYQQGDNRSPERVTKDGLFASTLVLLDIATKGAFIRSKTGLFPWIDQIKNMKKEDPENVRNNLQTFVQGKIDKLQNTNDHRKKLEKEVYQLLLVLSKKEATSQQTHLSTKERMALAKKQRKDRAQKTKYVFAEQSPKAEMSPFPQESARSTVVINQNASAVEQKREEISAQNANTEVKLDKPTRQALHNIITILQDWKKKIIYTEVTSKIGFGQRESSRS